MSDSAEHKDQPDDTPPSPLPEEPQETSDDHPADDAPPPSPPPAPAEDEQPLPAAASEHEPAPAPETEEEPLPAPSTEDVSATEEEPPSEPALQDEQQQLAPTTEDEPPPPSEASEDVPAAEEQALPEPATEEEPLLPTEPSDADASPPTTGADKFDSSKQQAAERYTTAALPLLPPLPTLASSSSSSVLPTATHDAPLTPQPAHVRFQTPSSPPRAESALVNDQDRQQPLPFANDDATTADPATNPNANAAADDNAEDENTALMDADNPLMERVQAALYAQLSAQRARLVLELREKEEAVRVTVAKREQVGVELYSLQQQLARQQAMLEGTQDNLAVVRGLREEAERALKKEEGKWKEEKEKAVGCAKNLDAQKNELEKISRTIKQVDLYNEQLRSKILVAKRTTMKAEEDLVKQEQDKKRQDYFIDHLTDQLRRLQERRALFETQLIAQQRETKAALETLQDAATEMEAIQFEKRQLVHQWKSSLIGLQRREDVVATIEDGIQKNKDTLLSMSGEVSGFRLSLRRAQEQNETLTLLLNKLSNEVAHLRRDIAAIADQKEKLKESYTMYTRSLEQIEAELATVMAERAQLQLELASVGKQIRIAAAAGAKLGDEVAEHLQSQLSISKGVSSTRKDNARLRAAMHDKEATIATVQNDLGHIRLETLNVTARIRGMSERVAHLDRELAERNGLVEKYELEIRRRNDELGKKQGEVDLLNKKYDLLTAKNQDESMGPLEATIHNLSKLVSGKEKECTHLSQFWLRSQNELVALTKRTGEVADDTQELRMRLTVLSRKKMVVNSAFDTELKEIALHQRNIRQLQHDMVKINTLLTRHAVVQNRLEENNLDLEVEFRAKLKTAELESLRLEQNVVDLRAEKTRALQGLIEAERQTMLWEKKIQLARETQAALDPNVGATEIREMEAEIHRMRLRHASMLKLQEKMVAEMEKSVWRRESIGTRTKSKGKGGGQQGLQNAIADLTKKIRGTISDLKECDQDVSTLQASHEALAAQVQAASESITTLEGREAALLSEIDTSLRKRELISNQTLLQQRHARRYRDFSEGKYVFLVKDPANRVGERDRQIARLTTIEGVVGTLEEEFGQPVKTACEGIHELLRGELAVR
ncbi:Coiled-coil domain-containing protein 40 [Geranomyces variabilis]|uniref:Coiled-coil domain-containing protein 40 n=1 Tax=Geranomyces variabilis TaxID=109894 RepID=A0AAD5THC5_9FUNG|nr:Coiled-coil domain-containing protein 40 [Geranomyces variabilis]